MCRYPDDAFDRFWWRYSDVPNNVTQTDLDVGVNDMLDYPPMAVMRTSLFQTDFIVNLKELGDVLTAATITDSHEYYMIFFFAEIDPRVNASGQRMFNITVNGDVFAKHVDLYNQAPGLYKGFQYNSDAPTPYSDNIIIVVNTESNSPYPASIAGFEVLELFDNPMNATTPTSSSDGMYNCTPHTDRSFIYIIQLLHVCLINF